MDVSAIVSIMLIYFAVIITVSYLSAKVKPKKQLSSDGSWKPKDSHWLVVAIGMIGTTLSGVTFVSVPGDVYNAGMTYFVLVLGNFVGYVLIAYFLIPLYYKMNLVSIYGYIKNRIGNRAYKTGAVYFLLSKIIGAGGRLFIVALVLQAIVFTPLGMPFWANALIVVLLIWAYTFKGGVKAIVWTDVIQTFFLVFAVVFTIFVLKSELGMDWGTIIKEGFTASGTGTRGQEVVYSQVFNWSWESIGKNSIIVFLAGISLAIVMVGLDQDMMQKNLTLPSAKLARKNFMSFSYSFVPTTFVFLCLGVLFAIYIRENSITVGEGGMIERTDQIFTFIAQKIGGATLIFFVLGITAAAFSSANSAMVAMTNSFVIDIYGENDKSKKHLTAVRFIVHIANALILASVMIWFNSLDKDGSVVRKLFKFAGYTYGPLLGLYVLGILTKVRINDKVVPLVCTLSILLSMALDWVKIGGSNGIELRETPFFGFEILLVNGLLTIIGLLLFSGKASKQENE